MPDKGDVMKRAAEFKSASGKVRKGSHNVKGRQPKRMGGAKSQAGSPSRAPLKGPDKGMG